MSDCYKCKYRKDIPGDCHSSCNHPDAMYRYMSWLTGVPLPIKEKGGYYYGMWPFNFDPIWLSDCELFEENK